MKEIFEIIANSNSRHETYEKTCKLAQEIGIKARCAALEEVYGELCGVLNDINNVGWEEKQSNIIQKLHILTNRICDECGDLNY
jgi:hypothetical protein